MDIAEAAELLRQYAGQAEAEDGPVVVVAEGRPIAAVVPIDDFDLELMSLSANPRFNEILERSRARHAREGGISSEEMRRRLGLTKDDEEQA